VLVDPAGARAVVGQNDEYPELFVRWFQYGTFLPTLRVHGQRAATELWALGPKPEAILAKYDRLRYALIPYIYSLAKTTYDTGAPFMRPLWMDFAQDPNVANLGTEYMFGPAFLVAPVTEQGQTVKDVYLPQGADWYDFWTGKKFAGGQWIKASSPIDQIPVFAKAGSIVPFGSDVQSTTETQTIAKIKVYPGAAPSSFTLYEDDGHSYAYQKNKGTSLTTLSFDPKSGKLSAKGGNKTLVATAPKLVEVVK
jgi:alpha-D-xyloside xylohydrolase